VLGNASAEPTRDWLCVHGGRYIVILPPQGSPGETWLRLDGKAISPGVQVVSKGLHHIEASAGANPSFVWLGPSLEGPPRMTGGTMLEGVFPIPNAF
jgi:hypothetical protein